MVARAEHALRGPLGALAPGLHAALGGQSAAPELLSGLELQLQRARVGLPDLAAARIGRRAAPCPGLLAIEPFVLAARSAVSPYDRERAERYPQPRRSSEALPAVRIDPVRLAQALGNVIDRPQSMGAVKWRCAVPPARTAFASRWQTRALAFRAAVPRARAGARAACVDSPSPPAPSVEEPGGTRSVHSSISQWSAAASPSHFETHR